MEGLELSLEDLGVSDSNDGIFDAFKASKEQPRAADGKFTNEPNIKDPTIQNTTGGEDSIKSPESVATKDDTKNQGQDGKTVEDTSSNSSSPQKVDNAKLFTSLAAKLKSDGVLPSLDLEKTKIESMEDINKAMTAELEGRLDSKQKAISEAMKLGLNVNKTAQQLDTISKLKEIPPEFLSQDGNDNFRLQVIAQDFKNKGIDEARANEMAQRAIDAGAGVQDAQVALNEIIKYEESAYDTSVKEAQDKELAEMSDIKSFVYKDEEILPGIKLSDGQKELIYSQMTTDLGNKENAFMRAQKQDPMGSRVKLEALYHLTDGLKDFTMFGKQAVKQNNDSFENLLRGSSFATEGDAGSGTDQSNSYGSLNDLQGLTFE